MRKIVPCLWFNGNAEEAVRFYSKVFKDSKVGKTTYFSEATSEVSGQPEGSVLTIEFSLNGNKFLALNGGPMFKFTEAVSFTVTCEDQKEIDYYWKALSKGGQEQPCGWLKDKFGLSWQIVPKGIDKLITDERAMAAMLDMKKINIKALEKARSAKR
jgi:predicted 3-demethylubiquinone-9 3-methyltransferase (glyoxalase superfamily)